ncbi:hypothetical protein [Cellulomonas carbonis]|nr:hypothetical protein [Cellulomonas carbonis]
MEMTTVVTSAFSRPVAPTPTSFQGRGVPAGAQIVRRRDGLGGLRPASRYGFGRTDAKRGGLPIADATELDSLPGASPV